MPLALPADITNVNAVFGRDERDVWMTATAKNGARLALHWDGANVSREDMSPCRLPLSEPSLSLGPDGPIVLDVAHKEYGPMYSQAHRTSKGAWECDERESSARSFWLGTEVLRFASGVAGPTLSGRLLPPLDNTSMPQGPVEIIACAVDDVWIHSPGHPAIWHWNGLSYEDRSARLGTTSRMLADAACGVWVVGRRAAEAAGNIGSKATLRWNGSTQTWDCLPSPPASDVQRLVALNERDAWYLCKEEAYHWDGASFQRGALPTGVIEGAWISPSGELWIVGTEQAGSADRGFVYRAARGGEP
ncbi:MAG: hypothetical protein U0441_22585 [Polyangiaceae bacterium]